MINVSVAALGTQLCPPWGRIIFVSLMQLKLASDLLATLSQGMVNELMVKENS